MSMVVFGEKVINPEEVVFVERVSSHSSQGCSRISFRNGESVFVEGSVEFVTKRLREGSYCRHCGKNLKESLRIFSK